MGTGSGSEQPTKQKFVCGACNPGSTAEAQPWGLGPGGREQTAVPPERLSRMGWADQHLSLSREVGAGMGVPGQGEEMLQVPSGQPGRWGCPQGGTTGGAGLGAVFVAVCRQALGAGPRPGNPHDLSAILSEGHRTHGTGARGCLEGSSLGQDLRRNRQARRG